MSKQIQSWYVVTVKVKADARGPVANFCFESGASGVEEKSELLTAFFPGNIEINPIVTGIKEYCLGLKEIGTISTVPEIDAGLISNEDWAENWKLHFRPVRAGAKFLIVPPWDKELTENGRMTLVIEPGMAFGTGSHESTGLAIELLEQFNCSGKDVWDIGTGTGILAIAAGKLGARQVYAIDIDEESTEAALLNIAANRMTGRTAVERIPIENTGTKKFDIITANLCRNLILESISKIADSLNRNGFVIFAGIENQDEAVISERCGRSSLHLAGKVSKNTWIGLAFRKNND